MQTTNNSIDTAVVMALPPSAAVYMNAQVDPSYGYQGHALINIATLISTIGHRQEASC